MSTKPDTELTIELDAETVGWIDGRLRQMGLDVDDARRAGVAQSLVRAAIINCLTVPVEA